MNKKTDTKGKLEKLGFLNGIFWCININVVFETTPLEIDMNPDSFLTVS